MVVKTTQENRSLGQISHDHWSNLLVIVFNVVLMREQIKGLVYDHDMENLNHTEEKKGDGKVSRQRIQIVR